MPALLSIHDIITPVTAEEIEQTVLDLCAAAGLPTSAWQPGSMIRTYIKLQSAGFAAKSLRDIEIAKGGFGDLASGMWVRLWAQQIYDVIVVLAKPATGYLKARNTGSTQIDLNPGDLIVAAKPTSRAAGKLYTNQNTVSIPVGGAWSSDTAIVISASEVGTGSNAVQDEITVVVSGIPALQVTNVAPVLGADDERNEAIVKRTRAKLGSLSPNGPKGAYDFVATTPLDQFPMVGGSLLTPTSTPITRSKTIADPATGDVTTFCATATGAASEDDCNLISYGFQRWAEPWCVQSKAAPSDENVIDITYRVWIKTTFTAAQVQSAIAIALAEYFAAAPVGGVIVSPNTGRIYVEALQYIIRTALPGIELVAVTGPADDVPISVNEVPVLGVVTGEVTFL